MIRRSHHAMALVALLAACSDGTPSAADETAAELRALRVFLQQQQGRASLQPNAVGGNTRDARTALLDALAPLRDVVTALAAAQGEQGARQLALTQEMQRWSQLLIESVGGARAGEAKAMAGKLQELEQALREQEARHREIETLLQGALDRTADRLEEFLQRLDGGSSTAPANAPAAPADPKRSDAKTGEPKSGDPNNDPGTGDPKAPGDDHEPLSAARATGLSAGGELWPWLALGAAGLGLGAFFVRRAWRDDRPRYGASRDPAHAGQPDPGVDEIWAAAALLGETVNRLRQTAGTAAFPPEAATTGLGSTVPDQLDLDEVFVLDEFDRGPPGKAPPVATAPRSVAPRAGPDLVVCRLLAADLERARTTAARLLADDPRVLRRPAPSLVAKGNRLEVTFATLPGLPAGERSLLEQRLRDAVA